MPEDTVFLQIYYSLRPGRRPHTLPPPPVSVETAEVRTVLAAPVRRAGIGFPPLRGLSSFDIQVETSQNNVL